MYYFIVNTQARVPLVLRPAIVHRLEETVMIANPGLRTVLFLDIDGVLHSTAREIIGIHDDAEALRVALVRGTLDPARLGLLCHDRQRLLADVLARHPQTDVAVSSAWRSWQGNPWGESDDPQDLLFEMRYVHTLAWLKRLLLPVISARVIGATPFEGTRLEQAREFVRQLDPAVYCGRWIAIDDQCAHFPAELVPAFYREDGDGSRYDHGAARDEVVVLINGLQGLTAGSANALDAAIAHASAVAETVLPFQPEASR